MEHAGDSLVIELLRKQGEEQQRILRSLEDQKIALRKLSDKLNSLVAEEVSDLSSAGNSAIPPSGLSGTLDGSIPPPKTRKRLLEHFNNAARDPGRVEEGGAARGISQREFLDLKASLIFASLPSISLSTASNKSFNIYFELLAQSLIRRMLKTSRIYGKMRHREATRKHFTKIAKVKSAARRLFPAVKQAQDDWLVSRLLQSSLSSGVRHEMK